MLSTCRSTQVKSASTDLWPQEMLTFSEMLALVESESSFGAYLCHRTPGGSIATSDLVRCMYVCMYVTLVAVKRLSRCRLVGSCVLPGEDFFTRPTCKTAFASLTQSQAISQSFRVFITFRSMRDTTFFSFFETHFLYKIPLLLPWWSKDVLVVQVAGSQLRNPPVKFRHERWLHLAIDQHPACPNGGRLELWPRKWFLLGRNPWR